MAEKMPAPMSFGYYNESGEWVEQLGYSADQMRAEILKERDRCLSKIRAYRVPVGNSSAGEMAADWTIDALREIEASIQKVE